MVPDRRGKLDDRAHDEVAETYDLRRRGGLSRALLRRVGRLLRTTFAVGVFSDQLIVALCRCARAGILQRANIEPDITQADGGPPNVRRMRQPDRSSPRRFCELLKGERRCKKPGVAMLSALLARPRFCEDEQFVVPQRLQVGDDRRRLKGPRMSAPDRANVNTAKAIWP